MKIFCVFSHPRSGTNYLHSVLQQWPALTAFGEIFHEKEAFGLKPLQVAALSSAAGVTFGGRADRALVEWVRANPVEAVDALQRVARRNGREGLYFKVFPQQWTRGMAAVIPALARLPGFTPIVLQRRVLDVYISYCKVAQTGEYKNADTTEVVIKLWADAFGEWATRTCAWYQEVTQLLEAAGTPPMHTSYERDIDMDPVALSAHWSALLGVTAGPIDPTLALARQDRTASLEDKLAAHEVFIAEAKRLGVWQLGQGNFLQGLAGR